MNQFPAIKSLKTSGNDISPMRANLEFPRVYWCELIDGYNIGGHYYKYNKTEQ